MKRLKVLFVCVHNSTLSQMAEALLNSLAGDQFEAYSAGLEPTKLNPHAVAVMKELNIDISQNEVKGVFDIYKRGELFAYVIFLCDEASAQRYPIFPGVTERIIWNFRDPNSFTGTHQIRLERTRKVRDAIKAKIKEFIEKKKIT